MTVIVILTAILIFIFFVSIAMGVISHFEGTIVKWFYFALSAFGLIGTILMFVFFHWDLSSGISSPAVSKANAALTHNEKKTSKAPIPTQPDPSK